MRFARSTSKVDAIKHAAGKQAAVVPPAKEAPRAPLGPSDSLTDGTPLAGIGTVSQRFWPARREIYEYFVSDPIKDK